MSLKKVKSKKSISVMLIAILLVSLLTGCGKDEGGNQSNNDNLSKQYVYSYEEINFLQDSSDTLYSMAYVNGKINAVVQRYTLDEASGTSTQEMLLYSSNVDGTDVTETKLMDDYTITSEDAMESGGNTGDGEVITYATDDIAVNAEVSVIEEEVVSSEVEQEGDDTLEEGLSEEGVSEDSIDVSEKESASIGIINEPVEIDGDGNVISIYRDIWYGNVIVAQNGNIYASKEESYQDNTDPNNSIYTTKTYLTAWDNQGTKLWEKEITDELTQDENYYAYLNSLSADSEGNLSVVLSAENYSVITFDSTGNEVNRKEFDTAAISNIGNALMKENGDVLFISYNDDWTKMYVSVYDTSTATLGEKTELLSSLNNFSIYAGKDTDFMLTNSSGLFTYNIGDTEVVQIMDYINSDLAASFSQVFMIDAEHFIANYTDTIEYTSKIGYFTKVAPEDIPDKKTIQLGGNYINSSLLSRVINFNKTNSQYRISIKDYSTYATMEDYSAGYTQLNNDIIAGNMPDILITDTSMPVNNYIAKGLLTDIGSLIEKDEELSQNEYMQNVFDAYKVNGKLYSVIPTFQVSSIVGKTSVVGDTTGWNTEEFLTAVDQMPEGMEAFSELTRDFFIYYIMEYSGSDFVDASTGKCNFDSQEFIDLLEYASTLPTEINYEEGTYDYSRYQTQYRDNSTMLMPISIYMIKDLNYQINGYMGEDVSFIGFPTEDKDGSVLSAYDSYVISSKSKNVEGAWEFLRYFLTAEYQNDTANRNYGLPVLKEAFYNEAQEATQRPYWTDENGVKQEYDDYFYINDEEIKLDPMSQEQLDEILTFITSVNKCTYYNQDVTNIITEEAAAFFSGQKTAEEVVKIVQSRVQIYVDENR